MSRQADRVGLAATVREGAASASSVVEAEVYRRKRWQGQLKRLRLAMALHRHGFDGSAIAYVRTAIICRIGIKQFLPNAGAGHANPISGARHRRQIAYHQDRRRIVTAQAQESEDRIRPVIPDHPAEPSIDRVALIKCRFARVDAVELAHQPLDTRAQRILAPTPVELAIVAPLVFLRDLAAHEKQLLPGMTPHEAEIGP